MTGTTPQRLLVIEDDPEIRHLLGVVLARDDRDVVSVTNAAEARDEIHRGELDLVVLDLILPDEDGRALLSELRGRSDTASVPVVVVTAKVGPDTKKDCYALGADVFVEKPFDPDDFAADVDARLERAAQAERAAHRDSSTGLLNRAGLQSVCDEAERAYGLGILELVGFDVYSEEHGWERAEKVEATLASALRAEMPEEVAVGRIGGGDFALVVPGADEQGIELIVGEALQVVRELAVPEADLTAGGLDAVVGTAVAEADDRVDDAIDEVRQRIFLEQAPGTPPASDGDAVAGPGTGRVIVAEDDEISATILVHRLEKEGLDVTRFDDGQLAYDALSDEVPDLVILDVKMPGLDGFEVLERLRGDVKYSSTPIVMLTSMGKEADVVRGFRLGADDYIQKPFSPTELSARVRRLLKRGRTTTSS